jgi:hypothetical protein
MRGTALDSSGSVPGPETKNRGDDQKKKTSNSPDELPSVSALFSLQPEERRHESVWILSHSCVPPRSPHCDTAVRCFNTFYWALLHQKSARLSCRMRRCRSFRKHTSHTRQLRADVTKLDITLPSHFSKC